MNLGYTQPTADYSLFTKSVDGPFTVLLIYLDDIVLVDDSLDEISNIKSVLDQQFVIILPRTRSSTFLSKCISTN